MILNHFLTKSSNFIVFHHFYGPSARNSSFSLLRSPPAPPCFVQPWSNEDFNDTKDSIFTVNRAGGNNLKGKITVNDKIKGYAEEWNKAGDTMTIQYNAEVTSFEIIVQKDRIEPEDPVIIGQSLLEEYGSGMFYPALSLKESQKSILVMEVKCFD